jgi:hypothetical protein
VGDEEVEVGDEEVEVDGVGEVGAFAVDVGGEVEGEVEGEVGAVAVAPVTAIEDDNKDE